MKKTQLVIFDLDLTLWTASGTWIDCTYQPYIKKQGKVFDRYGTEIYLYPDVKNIINELHQYQIPIAIASRTDSPPNAREALKLLGIIDDFDYFEIYPGSKVTHFKKLQIKSGIDYTNMVFFDDELRNIREVSDLGVRSVYVEEGLSYSLFINSISLTKS